MFHRQGSNELSQHTVCGVYDRYEQKGVFGIARQRSLCNIFRGRALVGDDAFNIFAFRGISGIVIMFYV